MIMWFRRCSLRVPGNLWHKSRGNGNGAYGWIGECIAARYRNSECQSREDDPPAEEQCKNGRKKIGNKLDLSAAEADLRAGRVHSHEEVWEETT